MGEALKESDVPRKEIFLTTKVWIDNYGEGKTYDSVVESLKKLQTDYLDLILLHQPVGDYLGTYQAMEEYYRAGKLRAIGVSNFKPGIFCKFAEQVDIKPMVNQVETHVFWQQRELWGVMAQYGTKLMAWAPLAEGRNYYFTNRTLASIGKRYEKTAAQVALRFLIQNGIIVIPKTVRRERMEENINVLDFHLTDEEMQAISALDRNETLFYWI